MQMLLQLFVVLASLIGCVVAQDNPALYFNVGTTDGGADVVDDGVLSSGWFTPEHSYRFINATILSLPRLYLSVDNEAPVDAVMYQISFVIDSTIATLNTPDSLTGSVRQGRSTSIDIDVNCVQNGLVNGSIVFNFPGEAYNPISLPIVKRCLMPLLMVGTHSPAGYNADIINVSHPVPTWSFMADPYETYTIFDIWLDAAEDMSQIPNQPFFLHPYLNGNGTTIQILTIPAQKAYTLATQSNPTQIKVTYYCSQASLKPTTTQITINIDVGFTLPIPFTYFKQCSGTVNPRKGLSVGLTAPAADVVSNGVVVPPFDDVVDGGLVLGPSVRATPFFFKLTHADTFNDSQALTFNILDTTAKQILVLTPPPPNAVIQDTSIHPLELDAAYECFSEGVADFEGTIKVPPYNTLSLYWKFRCTRPMISISVNGTANPYHTLIKNSTTTASGADALYKSPAAESSTNFVLSLNGPSSLTTQPFSVSVVGTDTNWMQPKVYSSTFVSNSTPASFSVVYNCDPAIHSNVAPTPVVTKITLKLDFGWSVQPEFSWLHECPTTPPASKSSSSWTPAGIFFFTVFIIGLTAFLAKWAYNYFMLHERGVESVPGIAYYRRCYNWAVQPKYVGPQEQTGEDEHYGSGSGSGSGGETNKQPLTGRNYGAATYQTDL